MIVSAASLWELSIKIGKGRLAAAGSSIQYLMDEMDAQAISLLPILRVHILRAEVLPPHHRDPFDRMIIAQALEENLPVLTSDSKFAAYGVQVVWQ